MAAALPDHGPSRQEILCDGLVRGSRRGGDGLPLAAGFCACIAPLACHMCIT